METNLSKDFWEKLSEAEQRQLFQVHRLLNVMSILRSPEGCPWDREQTHESLKPYLIEETYEVLEQLEQKNIKGLEEELGDLLLQIVFHAQIANESGTFDIAEVAKGISDKLIRRHPHIFGNTKVSTSEEVLENWEQIKLLEKQEAGTTDKSESLLDSVNPYQPALLEAHELQSKAAKVGFDWASVDGALIKAQEELNEVNEALNQGDVTQLHAEIGDLFFAVVNVARLADCHGELALRQTNQKFRRRFRGVEEKVKTNGQKMEELSLEILDDYWDQVKVEEKSKINE